MTSKSMKDRYQDEDHQEALLGTRLPPRNEARFGKSLVGKYQGKVDHHHHHHHHHKHHHHTKVGGVTTATATVFSNSSSSSNTTTPHTSRTNTVATGVKDLPQVPHNASANK